MTFDTTVAFDTIFAFVTSLVALLVSLSVMWREGTPFEYQCTPKSASL
jgi:hypothetical protein